MSNLRNKVSFIVTGSFIILILVFLVLFACEKIEPERKIKLTTGTITNISYASSSVQGTILDKGSKGIDQHGFCWAETQNPTTDNFKTQLGSKSSVGDFSDDMTGLSAHTTYYVRAYAQNTDGVIYGDQKSFITLAYNLPAVATSDITEITETSATVGGEVTADGGDAVTDRGIYYSTSASPETTGTKLQIGSGTGTFSTSLTGLSAETAYYIKAYATNSVGTAYGTEETFTTLTIPTLTIPTLTTTGISAVTENSAESGGNITNDGGAAVIARGVCWSTSSNPTVADSKTTDGTGAGSFSSSLTSLSTETIFYVRAYATNSVGTAYGNEVSFTTGQTIVSPAVTTTAATDIAETSATIGGEVSTDGGDAVTDRGVYYSTSASAETTGIRFQIGSGMGIFSTSLTGLTAGTVYYVKAYATNSVGTAYGTEETFITLTTPTLTTTAISAVTENSAQSGGNISDDGGAAITARGVCWSTSSNPTIVENNTSDGAGTGTFISSLTGLTASSTYYVRSYATNSVGIAYGNEVSFTTLSESGETGSFTDTRDSREYQWVKIGEQVWMAENLAYLPSVSPSSSWSDTDPYYYVFDYQGSIVVNAKATSNYTTYGVLYNWPAAMAGAISSSANPSNVQGVCPDGWHLPSVAEFTTLIDYLGGESVAGGKLKETGTTHWISPNTGATNESGFTALPGGYRREGSVFDWLGSAGYWWSSTEVASTGASHKYLSNEETYFLTLGNPKERGLSVRCVEGQGANIPMVSTDPPGNITDNSVTAGGNVTTDGGDPVTDRGVYYSTSSSAETTGIKLQIGTGPGIFSTSLTGLAASTTYYIVAYATNSIGTVYGNEETFTTLAPFVAPTITTLAISGVTTTTAESGGSITDDGGATVTARGVCWSTSTNPTTTDSKTTDGSGTGSYTSSLSGLSSETSYYVRAYATNSVGTAYGNEETFATISDGETGSFIDTRDSHEYQWVKIGEQVWMAENLAYLPSVSPSSFFAGTIPYYYVYDYQGSSISEAKATSNYTTYGVLYNWPAAMAGSPSSSANPSGVQGVCPDGWHLPSDAEWKELEMYLGMSQSDADGSDWRGTDEGSQLADNASLWTDGSLESDPSFGTSGFKALPGGAHNNDGTFIRIGIGAYWWSSEESDPIYAWRRLLRYDYTNINKYNFKYERGYSIRCVEGQGANLPMISTDSPSNISQNSATVGGNVTDDGGGAVTDRGIYYSTSASAETTGTRLQIGTGTGVFSINLSGLSSGTTYYIKAYATNNAGTAYGNEISFTTSVATVPDAPTGVSAIAGNAQATVTFTAPISDGGSAITGYTVTSSPGGLTAAGAASPITVTGLTNGTAYTFTVTATNAIGTSSPSSASNSVTLPIVPDAPIIGTAIAGDAQATVTFTAPVSDGGSAITGYTVTSSPSGFIAAGTTSPITVTGLTNGTAYTFTVTATNAIGTSTPSSASNSVTPYTVVTVTNPTTGKIWMDRNLVASQVATSSTDATSYGDLYQWGRAADGHQIRTSGTTSILSGTDTPGHSNFILESTDPFDWRSPQNDNLWQGVNGVNNPCPTGFRVPTDTEWEEEIASWSSPDAAGAYASPLKLPVAGFRTSIDMLISVGSNGYYWSSTVEGASRRFLYFNSSNAYMSSGGSASGMSVRCIKD